MAPGMIFRIWNTLFVCRNCETGVVVRLETEREQSANDLINWEGHPRKCGFKVVEVHPKPQRITAPEHVPDAMARDYKEAMDSLRRGKWTSAGIMFRRVLERSTLELEPDGEDFSKKTLRERIDALAEQYAITPAMKEWAHIIRLEGNEAAHGATFDEPSTKQLQEFTELFLIYAFTLPARVAEARQGAEGNEPSDSS